MLSVLTVDSLNDGPVNLTDGNMTLRDAIALASDESTCPGADEIIFDASLDLASKGTITLTDGPLAINTALTITGPGAERLTIDANEQRRVVAIGDPGDNDGVDTRITISGLKITGGGEEETGGIQVERRGGGIWSNAILTLDAVTISGNSASIGGGICNDFGDLTITNSTLSGNSAIFSSGGGGICNHDGTLTITNSTLSGNSGEGISNSGTLTVTSSMLSDNSRSGISSSGTLTIINSTLSENGGSGIRNYNGMLTVTNSTITSNSADKGGGIYCNSSHYAVTINNTIVAGNTANSSNPDIYLRSGTLSGSHNLIGDGTGQATLTNGTDGNIVGTSATPIDPMLSNITQLDSGQWGHYLLPNSPAVDAGDNALAVNLSGESLIEDVYGNPRIIGSIVNIGAVEATVPSTPAQTYLVTSLDKTIANDGILTFIEALQAANANQPVGDAPAGSLSEPDTIHFANTLAGTILVDDGQLTLYGDLNIEGPDAGGIIFDAAGQNRIFYIRPGISASFTRITITNGTSDTGGGIYNDSGNLTITNCKIAGNSANERGGGICNSGDLTVINCTITENSGESGCDGGGIYNSGNLTVVSTTFSDNFANSNIVGGGIYNSGNLMITSSSFSGNSANNGGGICNTNTLAITNTTFSGNSAGWGAAVENRGTLTVVNSIFLGNSTSGSGAGIYNSGELTVANSTLTGNSANYGGGIYNSGVLTVVNSTLSGNLAKSYGGGICSTDSSSMMVLNNTIVAGNSAHTNGPDLLGDSGTFSGSHNLIGDGTGQTDLINNIDGNQVGTSTEAIDPRLSEWTQFDNGRWGYGLLFDSPTVNAGNNELALDAAGQPLTKDCCGNPRIIDETIDIGAIEGVRSSTAAQTYLVTSLEKKIANDGTLTFIEAFQAATSNQPVGDAQAGSFTMKDVIQFTDDLSGTILLDDGELAILGYLAIEGSGADLLTFDAEGQNRVFSIHPTANVSLSGMTITGGSSGPRRYDRNGGGIYNSGDSLSIANCTISNCSAVAGGGVYNDGTLTVSDVTLSDNSSTSGGGIFNGANLTVTGSTFSNNSAMSQGGGIHNENGTLTVSDSTFLQNTVGKNYSSGGGGGGGVITGTGTITPQEISTKSRSVPLAFVYPTDIKSGEGEGGGICNNGVSKVTGCDFSANTSRAYGGGIYSENTLELTNSTFTANVAAFYGGGIYNREATMTVTNATFVANNAYSSGGGIYNREATMTLTNSTLSANASGYAGGIYNLSGTLTINNSILWKNYGGEFEGDNHFGQQNLIGINPWFVRQPTHGGDGWGDDSDTPDVDESLNDDYGNVRLMAPSPAVNYGENSLLPLDVDDLDDDGNKAEPLPLDRDGNPRIYGEVVDCGAFEFQADMLLSRETPSLIVTTAEDRFDLYDGQIALREAIYYLDHFAANETITFHAGLDDSTILLDGHELQINRSVTIDASSLNSLTIDAHRESRVFSVRVPDNEKVELNNLTITGGSARYGSGIMNHYADLIVTHCAFVDNLATQYGGGIYNYRATLTAINSTFANNAATARGGGINNYNSITTIVGTTFLENAAIAGGGIYNGGTSNNNSSLVIKNSIFRKNSADTGGGIYSLIHSGSAAISISNSILANNTAKSGAGIWCSGQYDMPEDSTVVTIANSMISGNLALEEGGGISNRGGTFNITNSTIVGNSAGSAGGGIYNKEKMSLQNSIVAKNDAPDGPDICNIIYSNEYILSGSHNLLGIGSGQSKLIHGENGNLTGTSSSPLDPRLSHLTQHDNGQWGYYFLPNSPAINAGSNELAVDTDGSPLSEDYFGNARIANSIVDIGAMERLTSGNVVSPAQMYVVTSLEESIKVDGIITFIEAFTAANNNQPIGDAPAGSFLEQDIIRFADYLSGTISLEQHNLFINGDLTLEGPGAESLVFDASEKDYAILVHTGLSVNLSGMTIDGSGICNGSSVLGLTDVSISNSSNHAIYNTNGTLNLTNALLANNSSGNFSAGGGIYNYYGTANIVNCIIRDNHASYDGGGIYNNKGELNVMNSLLIGNSAYNGGGLCSYNGIANIINSTFANNSAYYSGGGIYGTGRTLALTLKNSIVAGNIDSSEPCDINSKYTTALAWNSLIGDSEKFIHNSPHDNLIGTAEEPIDPMFADPEAMDYRLQFESPARNTGNNSLAVDQNNLPLEVDLAGHPRIQDGTVNMGAYEIFGPDWGTVRLNLRHQTDTKDIQWTDEWSGCWVEIWGCSDMTTGIGSFDVELAFDAGCFTTDMTKVQPGDAIDDQTLTVTIDKNAGKLQIAGNTLTDDAGQGSDVLLAKVYFVPTPGESVLPRDTDGKYLTPVTDAGFQITQAELAQTNTSTASMATIQQQDATPLWPVMFDLNGDSVIDLLDVSEILAVFQWRVDENAPPMAWAADFDHSGNVDLLDVSEMLARFQWRKTGGTSVIYPDYFPYSESDDSDAATESHCYADAAFAKSAPSAWSETDFTAIAKDLMSASTKKAIGVHEKLFAMELDPYADLE